MLGPSGYLRAVLIGAMQLRSGRGGAGVVLVAVLGGRGGRARAGYVFWCR